MLAIIYSFVSNGQQKGVLGAVESAAANTSASAGKLDGFMRTAEKLQSDASARSDELRELTHSLAIAVGEMRKETSALVSTNIDLAGKVDSLPNQLGEIKGLIESSSKTSAPVVQGEEPISDLSWTEKSVKSALKRASVFGLVVVDACSNAVDFDKALSLTKLSELIGLNSADYFTGFLVGFNSSLLISLVSNEKDISIYKVSRISPLIKSALDVEWQRRESMLESSEDKARYAKYRTAALECLVPKPEVEKVDDVPSN
ncbi:hypothetical protein [Pseudomonas anguilliseptica]|uniref:hypothetical protein n=1 Tax=Pseudomonas anguilliseptica TaxID=53406 RepID=UPI003735AE8E